VNKIHSNNMKVGELDIHYLTGGQGEPLVILHGGSDGAKAWKKTIAELAKKYEIYVPDLPGWGHSQPIYANGDYFIGELAEFVDGFSSNLGLGSFYLMGHSLGGAVALTYTLKFPQKVEKLVLVDSLCLGKEIAWWVRVLSSSAFTHSIGRVTHSVLKGVKWFVDSVLARAFAPVLTLKFANPMSAVSMKLGSRVTNGKEQITVLADRLSEIKAPTLVIWGEKDPVIPAHHAYAAAELIPNCQVKVFEDCGHSVYRQRIVEFSQLLGGFLG
jgi:pimeloyl-ACP methyl ester carboxylesterase